MITLYLMVGLPGAGKTTRAVALAAQHRALLLTPDVAAPCGPRRPARSSWGTLEQVSPRLGRRRSPVAVVSTVAAACFLAVWFGVPWWTARPWGGELVDREQRVSIVVPHGWSDATPDEAGQVLTQDASGDETAPYRLPDLAASCCTGDERRGVRGQQVRIEVLPTGGAPLNRLHQEHLAAICEPEVPCPYTPGPAQRLMVDQRPAVSRLLTPPAVSETVWVVTVLDRESVVRFTGTSHDWRDAEDDGQLARVLGTLRLLT